MIIRMLFIFIVHTYTEESRHTLTFSRLAAITFSLTPPILITFPVSVNSPVIARSGITDLITQLTI